MRPRRSGMPHRKAVRLAASSGVRPRLSASDRSVAGPGSPPAARRRGRSGVVEAGPGATAEGAAGAAQDEARRDGRPCPRDPRGAWPAMSHVSLDPSIRPHRSVRCGRRMSATSGSPSDDPAVRGAPVLAVRAGRPGPGRPLDSARAGPPVRAAAGRGAPSWRAGRSRPSLVLLAYRPGGPLDVLVGLTMLVPIAHRRRGPRLAAGDPRRPARSRDGLAGHRRAAAASSRRSAASSSSSRRSARRPRCPRSRRPTRGSSRSPRRACSAGSASPGGCAGAAALRRRRFVDGALIGLALTVLSASLFAGAAVANELAVRDTVPAVVALRPDRPDRRAAAVRRPARGRADGPARRDARRRGRPPPDRLGRPRGVARRRRLPLDRVRRDRPASSGRPAPRGSARRAWVAGARRPWATAGARGGRSPRRVDLQVLPTALDRGNRATAEDRGVEVIEGARARHCRVAVDGDDVRGGLPAGPLARRRRRPPPLARPARLLGLPRRPARPGRRRAPAARRSGSIRTAPSWRPSSVQLTATERGRRPASSILRAP